MLRIHGLDLVGRYAPKQHMCELCGYQTHFTAEYHKHLTRHHADDGTARPYECTECEFRTADRGTLKIHMRGHSGEAPYKCDTCSRAYTSRSALVRHQRTHNGEAARPYKCEHCPAAYQVCLMFSFLVFD